MQLKIKPSAKLCEFLKELPDDVDRPLNLQKLGKYQGNTEIDSTDIRWLRIHLKQNQNYYLHDLLKGSEIRLPQPPPIPPRNPELQARVDLLRKAQEKREYEAMVQNVSHVQQTKGDSVAADLKLMNSQLVEVLGFVVSLFAAFAFGFTGINYMVGPLDYGVRALLGVVIALIVAVAELYFLARTLGDYEVFHFQKLEHEKKLK